MPNERGPHHPILGGDVVGEGKVIGFAQARSGHPDATTDRLLLVGDELLDEPPARSVPGDAAGVVMFALSPDERLSDTRRKPAAEVDAGLADAVADELTRPGAPWVPVANDLIEALRDDRHFVWLTGGMTRAVISRQETANDLDLAGTAPPGRFLDIARALMVRHGQEHRVQFSPDTLLCYAKSDETRLYEYRTLNLPGSRYPAGGSDLAADAEFRDLTINSLFYDPVRKVVLDPSGQGLEHLGSTPRVLASVNTSVDPAVRGRVIIRAVKFVVRWRDSIECDISELARHLRDYPEDLVERLSIEELRELGGAHRYELGEVPADRQRVAAAELAPVAVRLIDVLLEGGA
ncbi:MAG TPA: hypothetical protein VF821_24705 [Lentzea sp.]